MERILNQMKKFIRTNIEGCSKEDIDNLKIEESILMDRDEILECIDDKHALDNFNDKYFLVNSSSIQAGSNLYNIICISNDYDDDINKAYIPIKLLYFKLVDITTK